MATDLPPMIYSLSDAGLPMVVVGEAEVEERGAVLAAVPALLEARHAAELARLVNHFAQQFRFRVIEDPDAFARHYREQVAAEDPGRTWTQGAPRLRDFGMPEFDRIEPPRIVGDRLVFFVEDAYLGIPYRVEAHLAGGVGAPDYAPMDMLPVE